jgi:hypothetical protein
MGWSLRALFKARDFNSNFCRKYLLFVKVSMQP